MIKDSGNRREFESGAVRDIQEGKGRCDLMPLDVVAELTSDKVIRNIYEFQTNNDLLFLGKALSEFITNYTNWCPDGYYISQGVTTMLLEVSKHFEEGAKKYGEHNWQKGIPSRCYIDSAVRHYLKHLRGDTDEPHDRAFAWNILCCIWTCIHKPDLNDYATTPAHWIDTGDGNCKCSECGSMRFGNSKMSVDKHNLAPYCEKCGAKMEKER